MKLNKFLLSLLFVPALSFVSCSDYEDTEVPSPLADENALGANFEAGAIDAIVHPDENKFEVVLNRVNTKEAATVPVTVTSCSEVSDGVNFCDAAETINFMFPAGSATATFSMNLKNECLFQEVYELELTLGTEKDHPYAAGTSSTTIYVSKDYDWKTLGQPVVLEAGWYNGGILASVQWASDYKKEGGNEKLFRIESLYGYAGTATDDEIGHLQFLVDENYDPIEMFSAEGYDPKSINTGVLQNKPKGDEEEIYYYMNVTSLERGIKEGTKEEIDKKKNAYVFTYNVFYDKDDIETPFKENVTATLDYDLKAQMKAKKFGEFAEPK